MDSSTTKKDFKKFIKGHLLNTLFWWFPILVFLFRFSFLAVLVFVCYYISFTYWNWTRYKQPPKMRVYRVNGFIEWGYYLSTGFFLFLTGKYVYDGLMSNYVIHETAEKWYVMLYAAAMTLVLATITYMIKTGRKWKMLCLLYLLFDIPGAMPFNFLHFYENQKAQSRLDIDKKLVAELKADCDSIVSPMFDSASTKLNTLTKIELQNKSNAESSLASETEVAAKDLDIKTRAANQIADSADRARALRRIAGNVKVTGKPYTPSEKTIATLATLDADFHRLALLDTALKMAGRDFEKLRLEKSREKQLELMESIKSRIQMVCFKSGDSLLRIRAAELIPNEPTQLESIEAVYEYVGNVIFSPQKENNTDERTNKLILMALIPSIIIDLLPLLFSIVYAQWSKSDEE